jgi:hypothetical protein
MVIPWYKGGGRYGVWRYIYGRNMVIPPHARRRQYGAGCGCGGITFTFTNPSGSSYFTMETIPSSSGFYEASSPKNFSGSFVVSESMGLVTSSYIASIVVQPGTQVFKFTPAITVTGTTYYLRGTGGYSLSIT